MEPIKQEIVNNIYENGENLITGPVLQEVLLDMVDDYSGKVSSSVGDVVNLITEVSESALRPEDLEGYATEQWVEEQGYLKEVPEGYATTESLNQLSESVSASISSIPSVDLSGYATTQSVNEATESVKEWVESKHYLTTASLSGSVTEESVRFMINDSTASVKEWVQEQDYATKTYVSESIAGLDIPDTSGFVTTQSYNLDSASFDERINAITGSDLSGYATTESLNQLSESVASDSASFDERISSIVVPDLSGYATTESLNQVSESVASDITSLSESIAAITGSDLSGYVTTASYNQDSASFDQRIDAISSSIPDLSSYATTESLNTVSQSISQSIHSIEGTLADKAEARDITSLSESVATDFGLLDERVTEVEDGKVDWDTYDTEKTGFSQSVAQDVADLSASIAAITGSAVDLSGYVTTASYNQDSASFDQRINNITASGEGADTVLREYLFGTGSLLTDGTIYPSASSNWVWEVSESRTFSLGAEVGEGKSIQVIAHNVGANEVEISFNDDYWGPLTVLNGVEGSGSFSIPAGTYGDIVATQIGDKIYFRTSVDLSNIEVDLSGYATTSSVQAISSSLGNYLPLAGGTLSGDLKVQSANVSFGNESNLNTINNAHNGFVAGEGNYLGAHWDECAIGRFNRAEDDFAIALGCNNQVGKLAQGMGVKTVASAQLSTAIGHGVTANACGQVVIGSFNELDPSGSSTTTGSYAVILGNGLTENWSYDNPGNITRQNGLAIKWNGDIEINYSGSTITLQDKIAELEQGGESTYLDRSLSGNTILFLDNGKVVANNNYELSSSFSASLENIPSGHTAVANIHNASSEYLTIWLPDTSNNRRCVYNCKPGISRMTLPPDYYASLVCTAINDSTLLCSFPTEVNINVQ